MGEPGVNGSHVVPRSPDSGSRRGEERIGWIPSASDRIERIPSSVLCWGSGAMWTTFRIEEHMSSGGELAPGSFPGHLLALNVGPPYSLHVSWCGAAVASEQMHLTGHFNLIPASVPLSVAWRGPATVVLVEISDVLPGSGEPARLDPLLNCRDEFVTHLVLALRDLARSGVAPGPGYGESVCAVLIEHLLRSSRLLRVRRDATGAVLSSARLRRVLEYVDAHLGEAITLGTLAREYGMSPFHFARLFKRRTGLAPHQFIIHRRMERARSLLSDGELSICEVAFRCGFSQQSHFTSTFRRTFGISPTVYRRAL